MKKHITALRKIRMSRYLTQTELAQKLGVSPCLVSYQERHGIRRVSTAFQYANALQCRPEELMDFEPPRVHARANNNRQGGIR